MLLSIFFNLYLMLLSIFFNLYQMLFSSYLYDLNLNFCVVSRENRREVVIPYLITTFLPALM